MKFDIIYADPAWTFKVYSDKGKGKSAENHYKVMTLEDMKQLRVNEIASDNAVLLMWATYPNLQEAFELGKAWGFTYKTVAFTWAKTTKNGKWHIGMGYYTRQNAEICLLFTKGKPLKRHSKSVRNLVVSQVREHSRKPDEMYGYIEDLFGKETQKIELFARNAREGWMSLGNAIDEKDLRESIVEVINAKM